MYIPKKSLHTNGFTLIELLIVVAIIGILAAIAIPQFAQYRMRAFNASAVSDIRNARTSEEAIFATFQTYGMTDPGGVAVTLPGAGGFGPGAGGVLVGPMAPATPTVAGGVLTATASGTIVGMGISIGNLVTLMADTDAVGVSYVVYTHHTNGNTAYGVDSDSPAMFWVSNPAWIGQGPAFPPTLVTPLPVAGADDLSGRNGGGAPTLNWTAQ